ncbi:MAG: pyridoxal phosphate-dependent aminotransferase [Planctomycetota bacterium]|nr:pyridoxal phosphate-dependent aminotransferase [Planctomycetota bacterium]
MNQVSFQLDRLISARSAAINGSGIRRVFDEAARATNPVRLYIGQPDFPVDDRIKRAACEAIRDDINGYSPTQGVKPLLDRVQSHLRWDLGWSCGPGLATDLAVVSGTSAALFLACMALLNPDDELILPDPYFVAYPHMVELCGGKPVLCDTYPDFRLTAARVEPLLTPRTKAVLVCSPGNPSGVVSSRQELADLVDLCRSRNIVLISDEIYDEFTFPEFRTDPAAGDSKVMRCPSAARLPGASECTLLVRGFGKTYGVTGWRLGYIAGPTRLVSEIRKLQQYTYVCPPTPLQLGVVAAFDVDMNAHIGAYQARRDLVLRMLTPHTEVATPGGAFYAFVRVPDRLGIGGEGFYKRARERNVFIVPGHAFSERDTHFRLSYATTKRDLDEGLPILAELLAGRGT